ncbi:MAG: hypothetical protein KF888_09050 [Nitrosomonas sp.]|nr:hypothetical protein [Nitrosomonas sp.]
MANKDSTVLNDAVHEQLAEQFPSNGDPFGVWYYIADTKLYSKWVVNDENGDSFANTSQHETALILSEALRIRHKKINNDFLLDAEQKKVITDALLIGLESFGEIERVTDELKGCDMAATVKIPNSVRPFHPTGSNDTIGVFAEALRYMHLV